MIRKKNQQEIDINDAYFGVVTRKLSWNNEKERNSVQASNLFDFYRVKRSVAIWKTRPELAEDHDLIPFCFFDVCGRCEFEFIVCPWPYADDDTIANSGVKVDVYEMYVKPNADILTDIVNSISVESARKWLKEDRARYKR